jgi:hypothetical protein
MLQLLEPQSPGAGTGLAPQAAGDEPEGIAMKAHALVPALALVAALITPPLAEAGGRHDRDRHGRSYTHGYYYRAPRGHYRGSYQYRPHYRGYRYYAPAPYGYDDYYGYYPPVPYGYYGYGYYPPPYYYRPRGGVYLNFGFGFRF